MCLWYVKWTHLLTHFMNISNGYCKKDVTPLLAHWSYVFLAITYRFYLYIMQQSLILLLLIMNGLFSASGELKCQLKCKTISAGIYFKHERYIAWYRDKDGPLFPYFLSIKITANDSFTCHVAARACAVFASGHAAHVQSINYALMCFERDPDLQPISLTTSPS